MKTHTLLMTFALLMLVAQQPATAGEFGYDLDGLQLVSFQDQEAGTADVDDSCDECTPWACPNYCWQAYAELLWLRARDAEIAYAAPIDDASAVDDPVVPLGTLGIVDPDYEPGFKIGFGCGLNECATVGVAYTMYESQTTNAISADAGLLIRSLVQHPERNAGTDWLNSQGSYGIDFDLVDLDYRRVICCGDLYSMNYLVGLRYAHLDQDFMNVSFPQDLQFVSSSVRFDGAGIRVGWEGERHAACSGLMIYGKATANFVAGEFRALYEQGNLFDTQQAFTRWEAGRIVTILDLELGVGWVSPCGTCRVTGGYMVSSWMNTVKNGEWINAAHSGNYVGLGDTLTFEGLTTRVEVRF